MEKILVVDDERDIADLIEVYLQNENYTVFKFYTAEDALRCIETQELDLAILDIMLPGTDGFAICQKIRDHFIYPVIMLTAKDAEVDKINGLTLGADDYVTKPFKPLELMARVKAQLRRYKKFSNKDSSPAPDPILKYENLMLDTASYECRLNGEPVALTPTEFSSCGFCLKISERLSAWRTCSRAYGKMNITAKTAAQSRSISGTFGKSCTISEKSHYTSKPCGVLATKSERKTYMLKERHRKLYSITMILFIVYLLFLVWSILFKWSFSLKEIEVIRVYNFIPFHYEDGHDIGFHFWEVINNALIFIPVGVYLCLMFKKMPLLGRFALIFAVSLALEGSQYILAVGSFDITDLITNTAGGIVGIGVYLIGRTLLRDKVKAERIIAVLVNLITVLLVGGTALILSLN